MKDVVVVDTSIAIKWILNEHDSSTALALLTDWTNREVVILAPGLLLYEATSTLYRHVRSGKIPFEDAERGLKEVILTVVEFEFSHDSTYNIRAMKLAQQFGLPAAYDAQYLALAESQNCELWTADKRMWNSIGGKLAWVRWMGDYQG